MTELTACWSQQLGLALFSKALCSSAGVALTVVLVCSVLFIYVAKRIYPRTHLPPGSTDSSIRVIFQLLKSKGLHEIFLEMGKKHQSDILCFWPLLMSNPIIMLNSYSAIREAMLSPEIAEALNGRSVEKREAYVNPNRNGIAFAEGSLWSEQRRFAMHTLRDFGFGKMALENTIRDELRDLLSFFEKLVEKSEPVNPKTALTRSVGNVICALVFGQRMGGVDKEYDAAAALLTNSIVPSLSPFVLFTASILMKLPGDYFGLKKGIKDQKLLMAYLSQKITEHECTLDPDNPRDYIDAFLIQKRKNSSTSRFFTEFQLKMVTFEFFFAGMETTTTTILWAILLMAEFPEVQKRVRQEIHEKIGTDRLPSSSDRSTLKYTDAVLNEVQRFATITPNSAPHRAVRNVEFLGYDIPENAMILSNIYAVHYDPKLWPDPHHFNPEANFIKRDLNGEIEIINTEYLIPFGVGRRMCLGDSLARQELWIFFVGLLQRFQVVGNPKCPLPSIYKATNNSLIRSPLPLEIVLNY